MVHVQCLNHSFINHCLLLHQPHLNLNFLKENCSWNHASVIINASAILILVFFLYKFHLQRKNKFDKTPRISLQCQIMERSPELFPNGCIGHIRKNFSCTTQFHECSDPLKIPGVVVWTSRYKHYLNFGQAFISHIHNLRPSEFPYEWLHSRNAIKLAKAKAVESSKEWTMDQ